MALRLLADLILVVHFGIVLFLAGGLPLVFAGAARRWDWVRAPAFRWTHLGLMGFVAAESLAGMTCPLTDWERGLREAAGQRGYQGYQGYEGDFVSHWVGRLLFHDLPPAFFLGLYLGMLALIGLAWVIVPPRRLRR